MKRITAALLAVLMLVFCLTACKAKEKKPDTNPVDTPDDKEENLYDKEGDIKVDLSDATLDIPEDAYYENYEFTVFVPYPHGINRFIREELSGTPVNDAMYNRDLALQDTLGVTINAIDMNAYTHNQAEYIIDSVLAGDHAFDAAAIHSTSACAALIVADAVLSFDYLEYCDLSKPWWIQGFSENCSMFDENYYGISSACWAYYQGAGCLLFNKDLATEHGLPDLYELVRSGEWTVDKLIDLTKKISEDLNGDGIYNEEDKLAIACANFAKMNFWYGAFRQSTVSRGENDEPQYHVNSARVVSIVEKLNTLFHSGRRGSVYVANEEDPMYEEMFVEGRLLFFVGMPSTAASFREYDINFGIIPLPKYDENQERYGSWVDPWHLTLCVPIDNEDPERTSVILEAMAYHSYQLIYPAIVEQEIFGSGTRDVESLEMLEDYIFPNVFFDFGYIYDGWGQGYSDLLRMLVPNKSTDVASFVAERRNVAEAHYEALYEAALSKSEK